MFPCLILGEISGRKSHDNYTKYYIFGSARKEVREFIKGKNPNPYKIHRPLAKSNPNSHKNPTNSRPIQLGTIKKRAIKETLNKPQPLPNIPIFSA